MSDINETKKIYPRIRKLLEGKGLQVFLKEKDKISHTDMKGNDIDYSEISDTITNSQSKKDMYDYILGSFCIGNNSARECILSFLRMLKSGGTLFLYIPHSSYCMDTSYYLAIPMEILMILKHIHEFNFEILDYQTYGFDGAYGSQNLEITEYAFQVIIKKANSNFNPKQLADDPGQMVDL